MEEILWGAVGVLLLVIALGALYAGVSAYESAAQEAHDSHQGLCALKGYYVGQVKESEAFLKLSTGQRVKLYGAIGDVPDTAIEAGLIKQRQIVKSLNPVKC